MLIFPGLWKVYYPGFVGSEPFSGRGFNKCRNHSVTIKNCQNVPALDSRFSRKFPNASIISTFLPVHKFAASVVGGGQSRSLRRPQPARILRVRRPEGHAAGQTALPLATAHHTHASFQRRVHLTENHCESPPNRTVRM